MSGERVKRMYGVASRSWVSRAMFRVAKSFSNAIDPGAEVRVLKSCTGDVVRSNSSREWATL